MNHELLSQGDLYSQSLEADKQELIKDLFDMVYTWGRYWIKVDENSPAYKDMTTQLLDLQDLINEVKGGERE